MENKDFKNKKSRPQTGRPKRSRRGPVRERSEFEEKLLDLARVTRVVAGGKRFRFRATVAVGNRKGKVGVGSAKGADVSQAIQKAAHQGRKNAVAVPIVNGTIPHEIRVKYKAAQIYLKPAPDGRGINAGGAVRVICDLAGLKDIIAKTISRSTNKLNVGRATIEAFKRLNRAKKIKKPEVSQNKEVKVSERQAAGSQDRI